MKKLSVIFLSLIMVITSVIPGLSVFASDDVAAPISVKFYNVDNEELSVIETGAISPKVNINATQAGSTVNIYYALFDTESNEILTLVPYTHTLTKGMNTIDAIPAITVDRASGRELKVFAWGADIAPADKYKCLGTVEAYRDFDFTVGDTAYSISPDRNDTIKIDLEYERSSYTKTDYHSEVISDNFKTADGSPSINLLDGNVNIISDDNGATRDYTLISSNKAVQFATDFNDSGEIGSKPTVSPTDAGMPATYSMGSQTTVQYRPIDGSDEVDKTDKVLKLEKTATGSGTGYNLGIKPSINRSVNPTLYDTMELTFDFRLDSVSDIGFYMGQGHNFGDTQSGANYAILFGRATGSSWWKGATVTGGYCMALANAGGNISTGGSVGVPNRNGEGYLRFDYKKWYTAKYVSKIDRANGTYSVDLYIDRLDQPILHVENGLTGGIPNAFVSGKSLSTEKDIYNVYFRQTNDYTTKAYFDNIKVSYSYSSDNPDLFIIGDSIAASYEYATAADTNQQGWGKYLIDDYIDRTKIAPHNLAYPGHRARWMVDGLGTVSGLQSQDTDAKKKEYDADWQHIKGQIKQGDYVLIGIGLNDTAYLDAEKALLQEYLTTMGNEATARGAKVIYVTVPPASTLSSGKFTDRGPVNVRLRGAKNSVNGSIIIELGKAVADKLNAEVESGSATEAVISKYYVSGDATHFNETGAKLVADTLAELLADSDLSAYFKAE